MVYSLRIIYFNSNYTFLANSNYSTITISLARKNAVSVALTIMSADCVISNIRIENASS